MSRLDFVFGPGSVGDTPAERAATSDRRFVRSQIQLALDSEAATGRRMCAAEALAAFGIDRLEEVVERGSVGLVRDAREPAQTFRERRRFLKLSHQWLASETDLPVETIRAIETPGTISSAHALDRVGQYLALDERVLGAVPNAWADVDLSQRLRALNSESVRDDAFITTLTEASWIIRRQDDLRTLLGKDRTVLDQFADGSGDYDAPTYQRGFALAARTRQILKLDPLTPIESVTRLAEDAIGVALIETDLGPRRVGAMITNGKARGIALSGAAKTHPLVRRTTLAHELGHLLWDRRGSLESVRVERATGTGRTVFDQDPVEMRANAFAIALLAPPEAVEAIWKETQDQRTAVKIITDRFGITSLAAARHLSNRCRLPFDRDSAGGHVPAASLRRWTHAERQGERYRGLVRDSRAGGFTDFVLEAVERRLISRDSARTWLIVDDATLDRLLSLFADRG